MHTGIWPWVTPGRPSCAHLRVVLPSAPEAIPTRWEGLLHQAKTGFKKRQKRVRQLTSTDIPSLPDLDDTGSLLTDLPSAYCDYEDDTELAQATWPSPQEQCLKPHLRNNRSNVLHTMVGTFTAWISRCNDIFWPVNFILSVKNGLIVCQYLDGLFCKSELHFSEKYAFTETAFGLVTWFWTLQ